MRLHLASTHNLSRPGLVVLPPANYSDQGAVSLLTSHRSVDCRERGRCSAALLRRLRASRVALSITYEEGHLPTTYGHAWRTIHAFWKAFAEKERSLNANVTVFLPRGKHLGARGEHSFEEIEGIFGNCPGARLQIKRAPWVPFCWRGCCWSARARAASSSWDHASSLDAVLHGFGRRSIAAPKENLYREGDAFRRDMRRCLLGPLETAQPPQAKTVVWMLSGSATSLRRIHNESGLVDAIARMLTERHPAWRLHVLDLRSTSFVEEARMIARASIFIALFGSALHSCRFMAAGATVVQIHGALLNDFDARADHMYRKLCMNPRRGSNPYQYRIKPAEGPITRSSLCLPQLPAEHTLQ